MSLTYSQKRFIQKEYPDWSAEEIAKKLNVTVDEVINHIKKGSKNFFIKKEELSKSEKEILPHFEQIPFWEWIKNHWIDLTILLLFVSIIYANGLTSDLVSDDIPGILDNQKELKTTLVPKHVPYFFVRSLQYFIAYKIAGTTPIAYRLFNLFFHMGVVWMVYLLVPFFTKKKLMPFIVAALVAVHPIMIESVTWISGGIYAQAAFFILVSFYFYLVFRRTNQKRQLIFSALFYILALSGSEKVAVYPGILLVYEFTFNKVWKTWKWTIPFIIISGFWFYMVAIFFKGITNRIAYLESIGSLEFGKNVYNPLEQIPTAIGSYLSLIFWPDQLTLYHSEFRLGLSQFLYLASIFIVYVAVTIYMYFKNKTIFFWLVFFFVSLLVTMNPLGISWIVAERYVYLGSIGIYFTVGYALVSFIESSRFKTIGYILITIILISLSVRTIVRNMDWRNQDSLWLATGKTSPSDPKTHNNLGDVYARRGDFKKSAEEFATAINLNPKYPDPYYNLGNLYRTLKKYDEAMPFFEKALELNPNVWQAYQNIAVIQFDRGEVLEAQANIQKALKINPDNSTLHGNLGIIYYRQDMKKEALKEFQIAAQLDEKNESARVWIQKILSEN
ncbi:hypothetical protein A3A93_06355 [Candidatus Roizmanbacteria bacterium RIFCSPLOWO2_01_FULL_38_12]|uniref:Uncharacterized protein n=2 Tax=Candidatus Roizmaniibacteriota TaxID=1752723 RepID=A0A1F7HJ54_9BACT|nr:MAG: hypothetical protein A3F29_03285 [Candidatus Roizmanbacteria bacterium RIFCSPHIGHO2_12_FULL_33_9]OGK46851.1 MAG: hypothetical protein A3A93_06355 [Candidatus Roizmanbacteria bacterium RIFCSPLOWO2_01_FULL_38_12]